MNTDENKMNADNEAVQNFINNEHDTNEFIKKQSRQQLKIQCVELSIRLCASRVDTTEQVVSTAKEFYKFVRN